MLLLKKVKDKRIKFGIASALFFVLFFASFNSPSSSKLQLVIALAVITSFIEAVALRYGFSAKHFIKVLPLFLLFIVSSFFLSYFFQNLSLLFILFLTVFTAVLNYIMLLAVNVFVVSAEKGSDIPLSATARTFISLLSQHIIFISSVIILKAPIDPLIQAPIFFIAAFLLAQSNFFLQKREWGNYLEPLLVSIFLTQTYLFLIFVRTEDIFRALILVACYYVFSNAVDSLENYTFQRRQVVEYIGIFLSLIAIILLV